MKRLRLRNDGSIIRRVTARDVSVLLLWWVFSCYTAGTAVSSSFYLKGFNLNHQDWRSILLTIPRPYSLECYYGFVTGRGSETLYYLIAGGTL